MAVQVRRKKRTRPIDRAVPVVAAAALVAGLGRSVITRRRDDIADTGRTNSANNDDGLPADVIDRRRDDDTPAGPTFLDRIAHRVPVLRIPVAVQKRFGELKGNSLGAAVTLQAFLALFPLLLVIVAVVGFFSAHSSTDVAGRIIREFGLSGDAASAMRDALSTAEKSRRAASVVGLAGLAWSGLGLVSALQYAYDQVWQVDPRGAKDKAVGVVWLIGAAVLFVGSAALTTILRWVPGFVTPVGALVSVGISFLLWWWTSKVLPNRDVGWRPLIPGAIVGAIGLEILKLVGAFYVPKMVSSSSELYGSIGIVFAILAWLLLFSRLIVYSEIVNVVLWERRAGTQRALIEVPRGVVSDDPPEVTRSGTLQEDEVAS